uniref:Uncharacterized protein n=1 Tax=Ascaris lumbricoides TaxID=6252 RepID=A0A0M3IAA5_ASCLU
MIAVSMKITNGYVNKRLACFNSGMRHSQPYREGERGRGKRAKRSPAEPSGVEYEANTAIVEPRVRSHLQTDSRMRLPRIRHDSTVEIMCGKPEIRTNFNALRTIDLWRVPEITPCLYYHQQHHYS